MSTSSIAVITDSNSGITQQEGKQIPGLSVLPMPFMINGHTYYEDIDLTQDQFYEKLSEGAGISTSQPNIEMLTDLWKNALKEYESVVYIPMSSGLSGSCATAMMLAEDFDGRVQVVNNQRISVTQRSSVMEALELAQKGYTAVEIKDILEKHKFDSTIYIMLDTLYYLKKGGRITPAAAALGTLLRLKPVLTIQGEKLDAFSKARTVKQARTTMLDAIYKDMTQRFGLNPDDPGYYISIAHTHNQALAEDFRKEAMARFPRKQMLINPLSLSISCHIGPGALAITCTKKLPELPEFEF